MLRTHAAEKIPEPPRAPPAGFAFVNSYAALPAQFYVRQDPVPVGSPRLIKFNQALAAELGIDYGSFDTGTLAAIFSGNLIPLGAMPLAMAYAGHQFGQFVPQLGDGRAILLGEVMDRAGMRRDIQLKGAGRTPYSRNGDGRAAVGPVLREYLVSEAMHALKIAGTRALAAVATGEVIFRDTPVPGAILTRVAASHVRVGTFQYFAARGDLDSVKRLADYVIERHYPELQPAEQAYLELLRGVVSRQAKLVASWMHVGFIHGVMNTDNMTVSGETIDFGPCAFLDEYDPAKVFSSIDSMGRYSFGNQPAAAQWNLARFAETLLPLIDTDSSRAVESASEVIAAFPEEFGRHWLTGMRAKLGLFTEEPDDLELSRAWLDAMHRNQCDYTLAFRRLCAAANGDPAHGADAQLRALFARPGEFDEFIPSLRMRWAREPQAAAHRVQAMRRVNPAFIPRNHRIEQLIAAAIEREDFAPFEEMLSVLSRPYDDQPGFEAYAAPPEPAERVLQTFCGT
jgi:serine/tyrosine/threonine adenylyltransferase